MALSSASCGLFGEKEVKQPTYYGAQETPSLEIPEGLTSPNTTTALVIQTPPAPLPAQELEAIPPRVSSQAESKNQNSAVRWGTAGIYLFVEDTQSSVNRRLTYAVKRSGLNFRAEADANSMVVQYFHQMDNSDEGFFSKMAFWRDDGPDYSGDYLLTTEPDGENTRIYLKNADGSEPSQSAAEHLLIKLDERLG